MSRVNFHNRVEGHRVEAPSNRDLQQKLTYQQLLNLNHDLSKENQQLKTIASRLGQELRNLHTQFDIRPREENTELYTAIGAHPILHQYELTLIPLLDAYQAKIQEFESGFETINEEFINLEKKYIGVATENQRLRTQLTDKIKELVEVYQSDSSEKLGADFGQIILAQINEKQKFLAEQNSKLEREYQKYKSQSEKLTKELSECKRREKEVSQKFKDESIKHRQAQEELKGLKEQVLQSQMKKNDLESEKKKLENNLQRAMSQVAQLNKEKQGITRNYETLKKSYERDVTQALESQDRTIQSWQRKPLEETKQQVGQDIYKKYDKLQNDYNTLTKEFKKLRDQVQKYKADLDEANERFAEIRAKTEAIENERRNFQKSQAKNKKLLLEFTEKSKLDHEKLRRQFEEEKKQLEDEYYTKIEAKQKKIAEIEEALDKVKLERDKLQQQNIIYTSLAKEGSKGGRSKDMERLLQKQKEKQAITEQIYKDQIEVLQKDNIYLKKQSEGLKNECKEKNEELKKLRQELQKIKMELNEARQKYNITIDDIKRVKNQYEGSLKDKERAFEEKIKQIRAVVEESERKRKSEREKVAEASKEYKRILGEIQATYEERIKVLEADMPGHNSRQKY